MDETLPEMDWYPSDEVTMMKDAYRSTRWRKAIFKDEWLIIKRQLADMAARAGLVFQIEDGELPPPVIAEYIEIESPDGFKMLRDGNIIRPHPFMGSW